MEAPVAIEGAFVLAGAGEFAFVVFALAGGDGVISGNTRQFLVSVAAVSMIAIPALAGAGRRIAAVLAERRARRVHGIDEVEASRFSDHVIIGGFGRVGQTVARVLEAEQIPYVALDLDAQLVAERRKGHRAVFYGDASRREILDRVGGDRARAFVVTPDEPEAAERMVKAIREAWPQATVHARALDADHGRRLVGAGATDVVPEALEGSLQLAARVLDRIGLPDEAIDARLAVQREAEIRRFAEGRDVPGRPPVSGS
jgi:CPA2 family monovalent cation:H+ antiporter-2